jgi:cytochrome c oxidase subunit III
MRPRAIVDVSGLPDHGFGPKTTTWWGTLGFVALEAMGFGLAIAIYFYLQYQSDQWPIGAPAPWLLYGTLLLALMLVSVWPNLLADRAARRRDVRGVRLWLVVMSLVGVATLAIRWFEFGMLGLRWDANAYGSIVWVILGLHTTHLLTDVADTIVLTVLMLTREPDGMRLSDVSDNAFYWNFVVVSWIAVYGVVYWVPRM